MLPPNETETYPLVRVTYAQARIIQRACGAQHVYASLDTTDRGSRRSLAKRWYRWFVDAGTIAECAQSTPSMHQRSARAEWRHVEVELTV